MKRIFNSFFKSSAPDGAASSVMGTAAGTLPGMGSPSGTLATGGPGGAFTGTGDPLLLNKKNIPDFMKKKAEIKPLNKDCNCSDIPIYFSR